MTEKQANISRRSVLATLAATGVLKTASTASANNSIVHRDIEWYSSSEDDLPEPGVETPLRYFQVEDGGQSWNTGDVLKDSVDNWEKISLGLKSLHTEQLHTEAPHRIHVRTDGSDDNHGRDEENAVATFSAAINRVANIPTKRSNIDAGSHEIVLEAGETFHIPERVEVAIPWAGLLRVTTSDNSTQSTLEISPSESIGINFRRTPVEFRNIRVESASEADNPTHAIELDQSYFKTRDDCYFTGADDRVLRFDHQSYGLVGSNTVVEGDGKDSSTKCIWVHDCSKVDVIGTLRNARRGIYGTRGGKWAVERALIENCREAMNAGDTAAGKFVDSEVRNCDNVLFVTNDGFLKYSDSTTFTDNGQMHNFSGSGGTIYNATTDEYYRGGENAIRQDINQNDLMRLGPDGVEAPQGLTVEGQSVRGQGSGLQWTHEGDFTLGSGTESVTYELDEDRADEYMIRLLNFDANNSDSPLYLRFNGLTDSRYDAEMSNTFEPEEQVDRVTISETISASPGSSRLNGTIHMTTRQRVMGTANINRGAALGDAVVERFNNRDAIAELTELEFFTDEGSELSSGAVEIYWRNSRAGLRTR